MKKILAIFLAVLLLAGCQINEPPATGPTGSAGDPTGGSAAAVPGEGDWAPARWERLSYADFFSRPRSVSTDGTWTSPAYPGAAFSVAETPEGLEVRMDRPSTSAAVPVATVPNTAGLTAECWAANGLAAYGIRDRKELLEVDLSTGRTRMLYSGEGLRDLILAGPDVAFFLARTGEEISLLRLYLPEERLDTLATLPGYNENWLSYRVEDTALVELRYMNPEFYPLLLQTMADTAGPIRQSEAFRNPDMARIFTAENQAAPAWENGTLLLCWSVQFDTGTRPLLRRTLDTLTGEAEDAYGVLDNCHFGTGDVTHDHFSPEARNYSPADFNWPVGLEKSGLDASFSVKTSLTQEELANFQALFTPGEDPYALESGNLYAAALSISFASPQEIPLAQLLAGGFPEEGPLTHLEDYLLGGGESLRLPADKVQAVRDQYLGGAQGNTDHLIYLEETDCYYCPRGASAAEPKRVVFTGGEYLWQEAAVRLFYTDENGQDMVFAMRVNQGGVGYSFWYHLPASQAQGWEYGQYD